MSASSIGSKAKTPSSSTLTRPTLSSAKKAPVSSTITRTVPLSRPSPASAAKPPSRPSLKAAAPKPPAAKSGPSSSVGAKSAAKPSAGRPSGSSSSSSSDNGAIEQSFARKLTVTADKYDKNKQANPFSGTKKHKSNFAVVYSNGGIPCRINHGGVKHTLQWDVIPEDLNYDPLLVTCAEGLIETEHPYVFISRLAFKEMLHVDGATEKTLPLLPRVVPHVREALRSANKDTFQAALGATQSLAECVGPEITPHLGALLVAMNQKMSDKTLSPIINNVLQTITDKGGPKAYATIKSKIPTFSA